MMLNSPRGESAANSAPESRNQSRLIVVLTPGCGAGSIGVNQREVFNDPDNALSWSAYAWSIESRSYEVSFSLNNPRTINEPRWITADRTASALSCSGVTSGIPTEDSNKSLADGGQDVTEGTWFMAKNASYLSPTSAFSNSKHESLLFSFMSNEIASKCRSCATRLATCRMTRRRLIDLNM